IFDAVPTLYRLLVNEQEIAGAVGSAALQLQQRRRGGPGLWLSLERRGRAHLLLCADLVRCYREEQGALEEEEGGGGEEEAATGGDGGSSASEAVSYAGVGGKRKSSNPEARGGGGGRKRPRAVDPWEDMMRALSPSEGEGRLSSIPGGGRSGR
ncbi:unnamed protein product, partial [Ectocarpus fasciculatus]